MQLLPADYAICAITVVLAVVGLFRGLSGMLAFAAASAAAMSVASFGWVYSAVYTDVTWQRAAGVLVAVLLAYGIVRLVVKRLVTEVGVALGYLVHCVHALNDLSKGGVLTVKVR